MHERCDLNYGDDTFVSRVSASIGKRNRQSVFLTTIERFSGNGKTVSLQADIMQAPECVLNAKLLILF